MRYSGVLFDLFGTHVAPFRMREHMDVIRECADCLEIDFEAFHHLWGETYPQRAGGEFPTIGDQFQWIASQIGGQAPAEALRCAEETFETFTVQSPEPVVGALEVLGWLRSQGLRLGLVSNCGPDVPRLWSKSAFAGSFDSCAFSCQIGAMKPDPRIYRSALEALGLRPSETLYVGDGSDEELSGAALCGMQPVLISVDLSNTYDNLRTDVDAWDGPRIRSLREIREIVADLAPGTVSDGDSELRAALAL